MSVSDKYRDEFVRGYIECALWSSNDGEGTPLDDDHGPDDIATESIMRMTLDCDAFMSEQSHDLEGIEPGQAGHDFWLTRNGHGAGFWDRGLGALGERLSDAAKACGTSDLYIGDDGTIYVA
jgi:hypothetical protein